MKLTVATFATTLAVAAAATDRRLSFESIASYKPGSQVTDHCAIDLDQAAIEKQLGYGTTDSFSAARMIYNEGGHSKSHAVLTLAAPLIGDISRKDEVVGKNAAGNEIRGKAYADAAAGVSLIKVAYATTDIQASYVGCQVGALKETNTDGCFEEAGTLLINGVDQAYNYIVAEDNNNGRSIAGFSTGAEGKMLEGCKGCPYDDFKYFYDYYGRADYAHEWVEAAFEGRATSFTNGNADFSLYGNDGKTQVIKKGTAYMNVFMYVIREFEDALDDCTNGELADNYGSVHAWDEGVCFYSGSLEGEDGIASGKLLHELADKRCADYKTCGVNGMDLDGKSSVNYRIFDALAAGNYELTSGNCPAARESTKKIVDLMYIPMIQGAIKYAYKVDKTGGGEKEAAEGAVFAAAVLPRAYEASSDAGKIIYENTKVGAGSTDSAAVKAAFESTYSALGITCADVGGLWDTGSGAYYEGMEPCEDDSTAEVEASASESSAGMVSAGAALSMTALGLLF